MPLLTPDRVETRNARPSTMMMPISHVPAHRAGVLHAGGDLQDAQAQRRGGAEDGGEMASTSMSLPRNLGVADADQRMNAEISWRGPSGRCRGDGQADDTRWPRVQGPGTSWGGGADLVGSAGTPSR